MVRKNCFGRECKLAWGYNDSSNTLIPLEGSFYRSKPATKNVWWYSVFPLSSTNISSAKFISSFLEPGCQKALEFQIVFDDNEYWVIRCQLRRQKHGCRKLREYPSECNHYVSAIDYGIDLWILFPQTKFPKGIEEMKALLKEGELHEVQGETECKLLINYDEVRVILLRELADFMEELHKQEFSDEDIAVSFKHKKIVQNFKETPINNQREFACFLSHLYCVYRKIEMKMETAGYPPVPSDAEFGTTSFNKIRFNLKRTKEEYKSMDRNDFLEMYPVVKKLFFCYTDYIRYSIGHASDMDEGDNLPGTADEIEPWLTQLNTWFPIKVNGKWINCLSPFIATPSGYEHVVETLHRTVKFSNSLVINNDEVVEPYIGYENTRVLFGFVDMEGAETSEVSSNSSLLESECPEKCTQDVRSWICTKCGDFVSVEQKSTGEPLLFCTCGSRRYTSHLLKCHHPSSQMQVQEARQDDSRDELLGANDVQYSTSSQQTIHTQRKPIGHNYIVEVITLSDSEEEYQSPRKRRRITFKAEPADEPRHEDSESVISSINFTEYPGIDEDTKPNVGNSQANPLAALPYAFNLIPAPPACAADKWISNSDGLTPKTVDEVKRIMLKFHCAEESRRRNLFIYDTLLQPLQTHTVFKGSEGVDLSFPTPYSTFFRTLNEIRNSRMNAYIIPNIYIVYGMDLTIRASNTEHGLEQLCDFIEKLFKALDQDFGKESAQRFKSGDSAAVVSPQYPVVHFITIPHCKTDVPRTIDYNNRFDILNQYLRDCVRKNNGKNGRTLKLIDWQREVEEREAELRESYTQVSKDMVDMRAIFLHHLVQRDQAQFIVRA